jgi:hypothetical protein
MLRDVTIIARRGRLHTPGLRQTATNLRIKHLQETPVDSIPGFPAMLANWLAREPNSLPVVD